MPERVRGRPGLEQANAPVETDPNVRRSRISMNHRGLDITELSEHLQELSCYPARDCRENASTVATQLSHRNASGSLRWSTLDPALDDHPITADVAIVGWDRHGQRRSGS
jgi:hypothetical protein